MSEIWHHYLHTPIKKLATHPLDTFQNAEELSKYRGRVNGHFDLPSECPHPFEKVITCVSVFFGILRKLQMLSHFGKSKRILVQILALLSTPILIFSVWQSGISHFLVYKSQDWISIILHIRRFELNPRSWILN